MSSVIKNVFRDLALPADQEQFTDLLEHRGVRIERIVSHAHASPDGFWYEQAWDEWVLLLSGSAALAFEDHVLELLPGDHVMIAAGQRHRVQSTCATQATVWLAVHWPEDHVGAGLA